MKKILFFLLVLASFTLSAQNAQMWELMHNTQPSRNVTDVPAENIQFWVGSGSNEVVAAFFFCANPAVGIAYGYRFDGTATILDMWSAINAADPNFTFTYSGPSVTGCAYNNGTVICPNVGGMLMYTVNGSFSSGLSDPLVDGDYFEMCEWGDCTLPVTNIYYPVDPSTPTAVDATIDADDILYWVGEGSNDVVFIVNWCDTAIAMAWGVHFNGDSILVADILDTILAYDDRFDYDIDNGWVNDLIFVNENDSLSLQGSYFMYNVNGENASGINLQYVQNGDYIKFGDEMCGFHDESWVFVWNTPIVPVPVPQTTPELPDDATISADNVMYWVGNGENEVVFVVNFCNPEAEALAWGVRFSGESAIVSDIFHTIELYDERFAVEGTSFVSNITFADSIHDNYSTSMYWMYNVNGVTASNYADQQEVHHGDVIKFGDAACGIITDSVMYTYAWTTPIQPVELPAASTEVFDGIVGSEGCQAIKYDDAAILGWATSCVVTRGYQNIEQAGALASYGTDNDAVGPSSETTDAGVVSLGDAGYAVLTFGMPISNGEGYDFAVFENALNNTFLELAFVEVSSDGEHYYRFPSVSNTQTTQQIGNTGGVDATNLHNLAGKYKVGWGTPFDLEELDGYSNLDINNVTHVRVVDVVGSINPLYGTTDKNGHLINDPYPTAFNSSGFDLSGVAVMNGWTPTAVNNYQQEVSFMAYPNPCQKVLNVNNVTVNEPVSLFNAMGQHIWSGMTQDTQFQLDMQSYPAGMYMLQIGTQMTKIIKK